MMPLPSEAWPDVSGTRPSSASIRVDLPAPFGPVIVTRSAQSICRLTGPSRNAPRSTTASRMTAATEPERGPAAISICSCHSLRGSSATSSRPIIRSVALTLPASFSERATCACSTCLSLSVALDLASRTPLSAQPIWVRRRASSSALVSAYCS